MAPVEYSVCAQVLPDVRTTAQIKIVAGRRPQPGSATLRGLQQPNDELSGTQVRTYDWILDGALAIAEDGNWIASD
jgi:hypothetical protein